MYANSIDIPLAVEISEKYNDWLTDLKRMIAAEALREAADEMFARAVEHRKHADLLANSDRPAIRDADDQYNQAETLKYESEMLRARADRIEQGNNDD